MDVLREAMAKLDRKTDTANILQFKTA